VDNINLVSGIILTIKSTDDNDGHLNYHVYIPKSFDRGPGSTVSIATEHGLEGQRDRMPVRRDFPPYRPALGPTQSPVQ
jgi:hypothetical protein